MRSLLLCGAAPAPARSVFTPHLFSVGGDGELGLQGGSARMEEKVAPTDRQTEGTHIGISHGRCRNIAMSIARASVAHRVYVDF